MRKLSSWTVLIAFVFCNLLMTGIYASGNSDLCSYEYILSQFTDSPDADYACEDVPMSHSSWIVCYPSIESIHHINESGFIELSNASHLPVYLTVRNLRV